MAYVPRAIEAKVRKLTAQFRAVLVTGPRQAGKTSLLAHLTAELFGDRARSIAFDTPSEVAAFRRDPDLFFLNHPGILFLDEVQHVPDLFPYLKRELDRARGKFRFFLSGSQHFELMKGVTESLAGRVAVLDLWPFAVQETRGQRIAATTELLESPTKLGDLLGREYPATDHDDVVPAMLTGGYPPVVLEGAGADWLEAYRRTYVQRDIRELSQVADLGRFDRFVVLCAGRSGTVINKAEVGSVVGIDSKTVDHWLSLLETSYQIVSLPAYFATTTKRLVKRPKWVFADSGLGLHVQAIRDAHGLLNAPHFGHLFESFVIMEIRKLYGHAGMPWNGSFWRTPQGLECDLVLPVAGRLVPIEIKHAASPASRDLTPLEAFLDLYPKTARHGILISMHPRVERLTQRIYNLPLGLILNGP
ncbi:MAG: ATP-binding protein [Deltaproteobacteria bacterium]|nr:ATP-binding protein [Deltaproteobacteria bacterium]